MKRIAILGSTGSVGKQSLDVIARFADEYRVTGLAAGSNVDEVCAQVERFKPSRVSLATPEAAAQARAKLPPDVEVLVGVEGAKRVAAPETHGGGNNWEREGVDLVIAAMVGAAGLEPTLAAARAGKSLALANKETLVIAGELVMGAARANESDVLPVDSEHSAIFQSLAGQRRHEVLRLILTASGGPFRERARATFDDITVEEALKHPTWRMGPKITIDSATLMNKGLEVIEARWLFDVAQSQIDIIIHPQSLIHSMVEYVDGSIIAQLGTSDMRVPIAFCLAYPYRHALDVPRLDLCAVARMTFEQPDPERFPCYRLAYQALAAGGTMPAVLNAANEVAVAAFLDKRIRFTAIAQIIAETMAALPVEPADSLDTLLDADRRARELASARTVARR